ncbi:hypothetical protein SJI00_07635 [Pseudomonas sp. RP23018S]|uniref:hypothetical protein n=1 Tax=Pseudomonas sp. RP23018S TaxID=3096037 RepID=UPI002ACAD542|nr:hypothetical protein [Pseudomonas sp. RP23018S]MDZ5602640.1 hypothetical protein [Pseudomonas sp. RP23018S]
MSLAMTLLSLLSAWVAVALALLWGVLRVARRHHGEPAVKPAPVRHQQLVWSKFAG